ncbi:hypothetical protein H5410_061355 [Solanum commersonii]|uniref:Uncharacterized protein n=1 Tax=Solanum commersonii TaxID=4109 RepID=A0A9J5W7K1_SOLCO|nr:hypothetical protein H5410_061355 [Solanum commersonii]
MKVWSKTVESKEFMLRWTKMEYLESKFNNIVHEVGSVIKGNGDIDNDVTNHSGVTCTKKEACLCSHIL